MEKYLKRWNRLNIKQKTCFFDFYLNCKIERFDACLECPNGDGTYDDNGLGYGCNPCFIMFPKIWMHSSGRAKNCPCNVYMSGDGRIEDNPSTVIEYCLIHDGWIEEE
jgi:hypothetical protein